jgi:hypothetical protein
MTHNNIGTAYTYLGVVEDKANNCKKAIEAFKKLLKSIYLRVFPFNTALSRIT